MRDALVKLWVANPGPAKVLKEHDVGQLNVRGHLAAAKLPGRPHGVPDQRSADPVAPVLREDRQAVPL